MGSIDYPLSPISVALGAEATFVARSVDRDTKHLTETIERAAKHKGTAFVEVFQNCNIFNDGAFDAFVERAVRDDRMLYLEHGKPLIFGKEHNKGIRWTKDGLEVVELGNGLNEADLLVHDEHRQNPSPAFLLAHMEYPEFPVPVGVFRAVDRPSYEVLLEEQVQAAIRQRGKGDLEKLLRSGDTWVIQ
jgi:2-oxoglutarate ferredoxin oxidoreductase subunit beta